MMGRASPPVARSRTPRWVPWAYMLAQLLTAWALVLDVATFATNDYTAILLQAIGCAFASAVLVALVVRHVPLFHRTFCGGLVLLDVYVVWNAGERLLGW